MTRPPLREAIVLSWLCEAAGIVVGIWPPVPLSAAESAAAAALDVAPAWLESLSQAQAVGIVAGAASMLLLHLVGTIGLFFYRRWARTLCVATTLLTCLAMPFLGATLYGAIEGALLDFATLAWGAALALAYWSSAAQRFDLVRNAASDVDITVLAPP